MARGPAPFTYPDPRTHLSNPPRIVFDPRAKRSPSTLLRGLGEWDTIALVLGAVVGATFFADARALASGAGAPGLTLLVWAAAGGLATCGALCFAELCASIPETGGTYAFLRRAYGERVPIAFLFGWTTFFAIAPASIAAVAWVVGLNAGQFLPAPLGYGLRGAKVGAIIVILALTVINTIGVGLAGRTQRVFTALQVSGIFIIAFMCIWFGGSAGESVTPLLPAMPLHQIPGAALPVMVLAMFAFSGWHLPTHVAGEIESPESTVPRAVLIGMAVAVFLALAVNLAVFSALPFDQVQGSGRPVSDAMESLFGPAAALFTGGVILASGIAALNAQLLSYPRIAFAMARDEVFFRRLADVDLERRTPGTAVLATGALASCFVLLGGVEEILTAVAFIAHLFITLAVLALFVLRLREPDLDRPYLVPFYPFTPALFLGASALYLTGLLRARVALSTVGITICALGIPFFLWWTLRRATPPKGF